MHYDVVHNIHLISDLLLDCADIASGDMGSHHEGSGTCVGSCGSCAHHRAGILRVSCYCLAVVVWWVSVVCSLQVFPRDSFFG